MTAAGRPLLMTPGPTRIPERVLRAGAGPMVHHRSGAFLAEFGEMLRLLSPVFGTREVVLPVHTTGRGAMEATLCNLCSAGDEIVVCANGRFGEFWARLADTYGLVVHRVATDWARDIDPEEVEGALDRYRGSRLVALTATDTSTGVENDVRAICRVAQARGVLALVDGVSAIGGLRFAFDDWGVDAAVTASQKCLMSAPGLAFVALSERARAAAETATLPRSYWDFAEIRAHALRPVPDPVGTAPVTVVLQVAEALRAMHDEGLEAIYDRHAAMGTRVRSRLPALGLTVQCQGFRRFAPTVTAIEAPRGVSPVTLRAALEAQGILTAEGLGPYAGNGFRIGHLGDIRLADVDHTLDVLATVLADLTAAVRRS